MYSRSRFRFRSSADLAAKRVLLCIALPIVALIFFFGAQGADGQARFWAAVPVRGASILSDMAAGRPVLAYGQITHTTENAPMAIFVVEWCDKDSDGDCSWKEVARTTPPMTVLVDGGQVQIENGDYQLEGPLAEVTWTEQTAWYSQREMRARGFYLGDGATVVGQSTGHGAIVHASSLYRGTPDNYRLGWVALTWLLRLGMAACLIGTGIFGFLLWKER